MIFVLEYAPWAERDLRRLRRYLARRASYEIAEHYVTRLESYIAHARNGTLSRKSERPGIRTIGFEDRVSIQFILQQQTVLILRVRYAGYTK